MHKKTKSAICEEDGKNLREDEDGETAFDAYLAVEEF